MQVSSISSQEMASKALIRTFIMSGGINPPESDFRKTMAMIKNNVIDELARYCDELIRNFIHTHGIDVPGIAVVKETKAVGKK